MQKKLKAKLKTYKSLSQVVPIIGLLLLSSNLISCSSTPKKYDQIESGRWEARALVKDKRRSKKFIVNIDFMSRKPQDLRMDVTTSVGSHLASVAMNKANISYVLPKRKTFYKGKITSKSLRPVLGFSMDPKLIPYVLFDKPLSDRSKRWTCTRDEDGYIESCKSKIYEVTWSQRKGIKKTVLIKGKKFEVQMQFHSFSGEEIEDASLFEIKKPNGFRKI